MDASPSTPGPSHGFLDPRKVNESAKILSKANTELLELRVQPHILDGKAFGERKGGGTAALRRRVIPRFDQTLGEQHLQQIHDVVLAAFRLYVV